MKLVLIDFFSKKKNILDKDKINIYVCGPTTYDYPHIGNIRPPIIFDILIRALKTYTKVFHVSNITDIDDKIIKKSLETQKSELEISNFYEKKYFENLKKLNIKIPNNNPKVTENISGIINFIKKLIDNKLAYIAKSGNVYFSIKSWEKYGKIYNLNLDELKNISSAYNSEKKNTGDFVLWKIKTEGIKFDSPWGKGRPGWHTECSFFVEKYFGNQGIDIHGGGIDLKFPHHINEMAQYESLNKVQMAKNWIYVGHVKVKDQKMSKSLNNFIIVNDFLKNNDSNPNILRLIMINNHYSKPINIDENLIQNIKNIILKIKNVILKFIISFIIDEKKGNISDYLIGKKDENFLKILFNNLDTPNSISYLMSLINSLNKDIKNFDIFQNIIYVLDLLGFELKINVNAEDYLKAFKKSDFNKLDLLKKEMVKF